jgi:uncharacterized protein (TIGR02996 family)
MVTLPGGFLDAILKDPADDTPRLVAADWLEEHGGERGAKHAALIRLQCELAKLAKRPPGETRYRMPGRDKGRWVALRRREAELLGGEDKAGWFAGLEGYVLLTAPPASFSEADLPFALLRRGFVASVTLETADFLRHAGALFRCQPVEEVRLSDREPTEHPRYPRGGGYWRWFDGTRLDGGELTDFPPDANADELPGSLWQVYARLLRGAGLTWEHPTRDDALLWLSRTCIAYGRAEARKAPHAPAQA